MLPILRTISVGGVGFAIAILGLALIPPSRPSMQLADGDATARGALIDRRNHPEWRQFLIMAAMRRADELSRLRLLPGALNGSPDMPPNLTTDDGLAGFLRPAPHPDAAENVKIAGLPVERSEVGPEDETGSINVAPSATMPIDIGETSSFELPVAPTEEKPPVVRSPIIGMTEREPADVAPAASAAPEPTNLPLSQIAALPAPEQAKPVVVIRKQSVRKPPAKTISAADPAESQTRPPFNILQAFFASLSGKPDSAAATQLKPGAKPRAKATTLRRPRIAAKQADATRANAQ